MAEKPYAAEDGGVRLAVRVTPRASRSEAVGVKAGSDGRPALQIRLAAPPVDGAANEELVAFLADALDMRKGDVALRSGKSGRLKMLFISGDPAALAARLEKLV